MRGLGRFFVIGIGGLVALMVLGMVVSAFLDVRPEEIGNADLIGGWMAYRIGFYLVVIAAWVPLCRYLTRPRLRTKALSGVEREQFQKKRERDVRFLKSQWWKAALLLAFFEVVIIQQFGL